MALPPLVAGQWDSGAGLLPPAITSAAATPEAWAAACWCCCRRRHYERHVRWVGGRTISPGGAQGCSGSFHSRSTRHDVQACHHAPLALPPSPWGAGCSCIWLFFLYIFGHDSLPSPRTCPQRAWGAACTPPFPASPCGSVLSVTFLSFCLSCAGVVSRIEVMGYVHGATELLGMQVGATLGLALLSSPGIPGWPRPVFVLSHGICDVGT